jgi:hypothetical protein
MQSLLLLFVKFALMYLFIVIILAFREVDPTKKYKLSLYALSFSICILAALISNQLKTGNALIFMIQFTIPYLFSMLMAYFHFPSKLKKSLL